VAYAGVLAVALLGADCAAPTEPRAAQRPASMSVTRSTPAVLPPIVVTSGMKPPAFRPVVRRVSRSDVRYSYAPGCPVTPNQLRSLRIGHWGFDGDHHRGTLIVASWAVAAVRKAFRAAFRDGFRIRKIRPVERYYRGTRSGMARSDARSMRADNTSAFNCRTATNSRYSRHSWGDAVDVNPKENPHVLGGRTYPANGAKFADRSRKHRGMLRSGSAMTQTMRARGWTWGGAYRSPDYQHFSRTGA
jgi:D-alanyl-D-alanine carboxypeptidase